MAGQTEPVLTPRLELAPVRLGDIADVITLHEDPVVAAWTGPWSPESNAAWVSEMTRRWSDDGVGKWLARDRSSNALVGRGGFSLFDLDGETVLELGWSVRDGLTGHGYATEIGRAALSWRSAFFPQLPVVAFTEVHNLASRAVMRRLGMGEAGIIHREGLIAGRSALHPDAPFALCRID